jgi:hypothetical protein
MSAPDPFYVSAKEAAVYLGGLSTQTVYGLLDQQAIASRYKGTRRLVIFSSLKAYAESLPETPPKKADAS